MCNKFNAIMTPITGDMKLFTYFCVPSMGLPACFRAASTILLPVLVLSCALPLAEVGAEALPGVLTVAAPLTEEAGAVVVDMLQMNGQQWESRGGEGRAAEGRRAQRPCQLTQYDKGTGGSMVWRSMQDPRVVGK